MKLIVTGGLGHIGSALIRALPNLFPNDEIVMIDNMATQRYSSLFDLPSDGRYQFIEGDVLSFDLETILAEGDVVVHLAAITNAPATVGRKEEVDRANVEATRLVAEACCRTGGRLFFPSTTSVYGVSEGVVAEDGPESNLYPQSPYAESKLAAERVLMGLRESQGLRFTIGRLGTIFGVSPGMRFHTAVNRFCWQAVLRQPLTVWRTAYAQMRPYLYLNDALSLIGYLIETDMFEGETFNVVTENSTVEEIVSCLKARVGELKLKFVEHEIMNQLSYAVSNEKLASRGFEFRGRLEDGINETLALMEGCYRKAV